MSEEIIVNGLLLSFMRVGEPISGPALIFLHGWRSSKEVWRPLIEGGRLSKYSVYALDLPGFGGSQLPASSFSVREYADVVKGFIEKKGLGSVIVAGHSFGGRVGIKLAASYPELVEKLILVDSAGFPMNDKKKNLFRVAARIVKPLFRPAFMQGLRRRIYKAIGAEDYVATPQLQQTFVRTVEEDLTEDMKKISRPTLIIFGENDADTPKEFGERMKSLIPGSQFLILPQAGHFSFLEKPKEFTDRVRDFLN